MDLNIIKKKIESMSFFHQREILKILYDNKCSSLSENKNGTFINMSKLSKNVIEKLEKYIEYYEDQEKELNNQETKCTIIEQNFFKDNKDNITLSNNVI
jgi:proline dehydrogenase